MARVTAAHLAELRRLYEINTAMVQYFMAAESDFGRSGQEIQRVLDTTLEKQDLRGMRTAAQELRNMSRALGPVGRAELLKSVSASTGHSLDHEEARDAVTASRILKRQDSERSGVLRAQEPA